ncbi:transcriptional regulator [Gluconobacter albidus]|uniref:Transcriptional regulator n=1 Tax=Gluconobacter albidus TaxID=318683 RepID=A0A149TEL0_9PROT|nr:DNA-binding protein [Gluconobacter albidus]KXV45940.1 transcriptional regulator [Gluconobacter albidus]
MSGKIVQMSPRVLDIGDAAAYLAMSVGTFRTQVLPHVRQINLSVRRRGYLVSDLDRWIDQQAGGGTELPASANPWDMMS